MEFTLNSDNMLFTLGNEETLSFELNGADSTFVLDTDEGLSFSLGNDEALAFGLGTSSDITIVLETPTVVGVEYYDESYEVTPKTYEQKLETKRKFLTDDITILEIPYTETANTYGVTVTIG